MPSEFQSADTSDREHYPEVKAKIGEDPAHYLDKPLVNTNSETSAPLEMARDRINGIDEIEVIQEWIEVELDLDRGPRKKVIGWLNQRKADLEEDGERDLPGRDPETLRELAGEVATESIAEWPERGGERSATYSRTMRTQLRAKTDGGESG